MEKFSKTLAGLFAVLLVTTAALAFVLYTLEQSLFDPELYIQAFEKEDLYQRLPDLTAQALKVAAQQADSGNPLVLLRNLSEEEWRIFMDGLLPPAELKILAEDAVRQIMAYINNENDEVVLSLMGMKAHMSSPQGIEAIYGILRAQPDCTLEQLTVMALGQQDMMLCNPPETFLFLDLRPIIDSQIRAAVMFVPEQLTLISADARRVQELQDLNALRTLIRLSPLIPMFCLLMITILAVRSLRSWLNWWGYPLLFAGIFSILLTAISGPLAAWLFQTFVARVFPDSLPLEILDMLKSVVATIAYDAVSPIVKLAGIVSLIGLSMVVAALFSRKKFRRA